jgi:hypothetical protein
MVLQEQIPNTWMEDTWAEIFLGWKYPGKYLGIFSFGSDKRRVGPSG